MSHAEDGRVREPLPATEAIAGLPPDGGEEFNRLVFEQSPYLLQHARNPVDWWPWCEGAFERARAEDKPVFLSVGYTTCHWCHVMEHESFEDEEVAELMNARFVPVKVDREERPDIDEVYMQVTQAITGGGGWPMTVALTPDKQPFFAGTYFPRESVPGRAGLKRVVTELHKAWEERRDEVLSSAEHISEQLGRFMGGVPGGELDPDVLETAHAQLAACHDAQNGGFGGTPKFPVAPNLMFLLRHHLRTGNPRSVAMAATSLAAMRRGGIYDHIGFGIHRYSTDAHWLVPHFEKMLYDQALLTMACVEAYQALGDECHARTAREVLAYVQRDMTDPAGGFYSAEDADSEGVEGKFYVWTTAEVREVLGEDDGAFFIDKFRLEDDGNFAEEATRERTGANIPHRREPLSDDERERVEALRRKLFERREQRVHPEKDDKVLTDWNGLMISAFARAAQALDEDAYTATARRAADFLLEELRAEDGRLLKRWRRGEVGLPAHLEDYAFAIRGLLDLYEACFEVGYLERAVEFQRMADQAFWDGEEGGYFTTDADAEKLIVRAKKLYGGAIPSGNATEVDNLARLHRMTGDPSYERRNAELIRAFSGEFAERPMVYPVALCGLDFHFGPTREVVIAGEPDDPGTKAMLDAVRQPFFPNQAVLLRSEGNAERLAAVAPYTESQVPLDGRPTAYLCRDFACASPITEVDRLREVLGGIVSVGDGSPGDL